MSDLDLEKEKLELEKQKLELEKQKMNMHMQSTSSGSSYAANNNIGKASELNGIKTAAIWAIVGWFLFLLPGLIFWIILIIRVATYKASEQNSGFKTGTLVCVILLCLIGSIMAIVFTSKEKEVYGIL